MDKNKDSNLVRSLHGKNVIGNLQMEATLIEFRKSVHAALRKFDDRMPLMPWSQSLGSSASSLTDELLNKIMRMRGFCDFGHWLISVTQENKEESELESGH